MGTFADKVDITGFSVENIDTSQLDDVSNWLPKNGVVDLNIAEQGLIHTLHAQNLCQDIIVKIDRWIGIKEAEKDKAWTKAALEKAGQAGHKTIKNKEWFAQADEDYIEANNQLTLAKACKKYFEKKSDYFSGWHYAFKTFLKRDYDLERLGNFQSAGYNIREISGTSDHQAGEVFDNDFGGDIEWK